MSLNSWKVIISSSGPFSDRYDVCGVCGILRSMPTIKISVSERNTDCYFVILSMFCSSKRRQSTFSVDKLGDVYETKWFYCRSVNIYWSLHDTPRVIFGLGTVGFLSMRRKP